jgi:hypothetical protein
MGSPVSSTSTDSVEADNGTVSTTVVRLLPSASSPAFAIRVSWLPFTRVGVATSLSLVS